LAPHLGGDEDDLFKHINKMEPRGDEDDLFKTLTVSIFCPDWSIDTKCCE